MNATIELRAYDVKSLQGDERASSVVASSALITRPDIQKMTLFVRTRRVFVASRMIKLPAFESGLDSTMSFRTKRVAIYENVLDGDQKAALDNCVTLARNLGIKLEVKDVSRLGTFGRLLGFISRDRFIPKTPSLSLAGEAVALLIGGT